MTRYNVLRDTIEQQGFLITDHVFTIEETEDILAAIEGADKSGPAFRKTNDLFAIRQFLKEVPDVTDKIFNHRLIDLISNLFGKAYFVVKSIYFDKPVNSNWFVPYHQDLTISVDRKLDIEGFGPWSKKHNQFAVQPPLNLLQDNFTIRIHLDDTNEANGALKVIPGSHLKNIYRPETIDRSVEEEVTCNVGKGGVMFMKPLLLHASGKTTNNNKRRVVHIECSKSNLPEDLQWSEYQNFRLQHHP